MGAPLIARCFVAAAPFPGVTVPKFDSYASRCRRAPSLDCLLPERPNAAPRCGVGIALRRRLRGLGRGHFGQLSVVWPRHWMGGRATVKLAMHVAQVVGTALGLPVTKHFGDLAGRPGRAMGKAARGGRSHVDGTAYQRRVCPRGQLANPRGDRIRHSVWPDGEWAIGTPASWPSACD